MNEHKTVKTKSSKVQSVDRALALVDIIAESEDGLSLAQISTSIGLPKSTVFGLLSTLRDYNYIQQSPEDGRYQLGIKLFELGTQVARTWDIRDAARPVLRRLINEFGETVHLGAEDNGEVLYLEKMSPESIVNIVSEVGIRLPMHCSALGKVLLANKSKSELKRIIGMRGLPAFTHKTITTQTKLEKELAQIREQGYAIDDGEIMENLRCVAAPIRDSYGVAKYAISISGQIRDMHGKRLENIIEEVQKGATEITNSIANARP